MDCIREKLLTIQNTCYYVQLSAEEIVTLYKELKAYLGSGDPKLKEIDYISLMDLLFQLSCYMGKDVECEVLYKGLKDRFGENSPRLHLMQATLLQINENDDIVEEYISGLLREVLKFETDSQDYLLMSKKLLSIKRNKLPQETWLRQLLDLVEKFPSDAELWWMCGTEYYSLGQFDRSAYCFEEVLCITPFNYVAFAQLGEVLYYKALRGNRASKDTLKNSLDNFLRSVELSEMFVKGWSFIAKISKELSKNKLLNLARTKLEEIAATGNEQDKATAKLILESL